jgi:hypothetical protein
VTDEAPWLSVDLPPDPLEQDWDAILAAILRDGPSYPDDHQHLDRPDLLDRLDLLRVAGSPVQDAPVDGPVVAGLLAGLDLASLPDDGVVAAVAAASRLASWAAGVEVAAVRELTGRARGWRGVGAAAGVEEVLSARDLAAVEVAAALSVSHQSADNQVELAAALGRLPGVRLALAAGRLDLVKVRAIVEAVSVLDDDAAAQVEARVLGRAATQTVPNLRAALRRAVIAADPAAAERRRLALVEARAVVRRLDQDGMATLEWTSSVEQVQGFWLWLTGCATAVRGPAAQDPRTLDQRRSDVLAEIGARGLAQSVTHTGAALPRVKGRRPQIGVVVAATTLLGLDEEPGELTGAGPITAPLARRIAAHGTWRRLLVDPRTGRLDEVSADTYQPPQDMVDHVVARDGTCRGIGCRVSAGRSDIDHQRPWPAGPTAVDNLDAKHRFHHRIKTHTDTTVRTDPDGTTVWTLPSGRTYRVPPHQVLDHPDLDPPALRDAMHNLRDAIGQNPQNRGAPEEVSDPDPPPEPDIPPF